MGSFKSFALAGVFAFAASASSFAADLLPPPAMPSYAPAPVAEIASGWYLRGDVGVGALDFDKFEGVDKPGFAGPPGGYRLDQKVIGDQAFVGFGVGYQFNSWFRADVTGEYRTKTQVKTVESFIYPGDPARSSDVVEAKLSSIVGLVNGYFDLGNFHGFSPFIGAGVGFASHRISGLSDMGAGFAAGGIGVAPEKDMTKFAWALHAGVGYEVTPNLKLELAYRYLNMGNAQAASLSCDFTVCPGTVYNYKKLDSHDIKIGMRWMFGGPAYPVDMPLMRKY